MLYTVRPLSDRTWLRPAAARKAHQFDAGWTATLQLLGKEIDQLGGRDVVLECDVEERHLRNDGMLRSDAKPSSDAIVVAFESKHGPLLYRSDRYMAYWSGQMPGWQANVRAVALTLQALRAVDRYGATETGQQYAGFKALPAGRAMPASHMTSHEAYSLLSRVSGNLITHGESIQSTRARYREARIAAHPDRNGGDHTVWHQVEEAGRVLGVA